MDDHRTAASRSLGVDMEGALDASVLELVLQDSANLIVTDAADEGTLLWVFTLQNVVCGSDGVE